METEVHAAEQLNIEVMPVHPYQERARCPKCGFRAGLINHLRNRYCHKFHYCAGNKDSTADVNDIFGRSHEVKVPCAGVFEEHIHIQCGKCDFHWLTKPKGK